MKSPYREPWEEGTKKDLDQEIKQAEKVNLRIKPARPVTFTGADGDVCGHCAADKASEGTETHHQD